MFQPSTDVCIVVASSEVRADAKQAIGLHDAADEVEQAGLCILEAANANEALAMLEARSDDVQVLFTALDIPGSMIAWRWPSACTSTAARPMGNMSGVSQPFAAQALNW
ncbi:hypothetical protein [Microvirga sp. VF16]|uniref:hypothetical protein n=1 Tax=Microvirga sp. VF16 TaxID=2807101 RepID=UPI00193DF6E6|nr:hypothetical protein [Microvirga sp. VF16]QRM28790.1 hypothetical protein JO965_21670 [Microvirga sp. VF16]